MFRYLWVAILGSNGLPVGGMKAIAAGYQFGVALRESDGSVWAWGRNAYGDLGDGSVADRSAPAQVKTGANTYLTGASKIAAYGQHAAAIVAGNLWMWGDNAGGDLGIGSTTYSAYAVQARTNSTTILQNVTDVAIGMDHTVVLTSDGRVYAMGNNSLGALGDGSLTSRSYAVSVKDANGLPITGVRAIAAGRYNTLLLMQDGTVRFTGDNSAGQLGNGTFSPSTVVNPVSIANLTGVELVTMTFQHVLTRRSDGTVWSWGSNSTSQLGDQRTSFTTPNPATPAEVPGI